MVSMSQLESLNVHITEKFHSPVTIKSLDQKEIKLNDSNCIIVREE